MAKSVRMPSKAQMLKDDMKWRAESMVRDRMMEQPAVKKEINRVCADLMKVQKSVKLAVPKKRGK